MRSSPRLFCYFGLIAPIWLLAGVTYSGLIYPGYSHLHQAMSELHAVGSPIESIAPFINHYPLSILFAGFGFYVMSCFSSRPASASGFLILLHGVATFSAGYFPCDVGCVPETPSTSQVVHGLSGFVILLTLLIAPAIWTFIARRELKIVWFGWFSAAVFLGQILMMIPTLEAVTTGEQFGLYQRLAYSIPLVWLFVFAFVLIRDSRRGRLTGVSV
tara:strand:+ start:3656 stop:4303 length:648 start_codon:yes stop_codon:yes gene_type:complete